MQEQHIMPALARNAAGRLTLETADLGNIANEFGTPAYVMSEATVVNNCRAFIDAFDIHYGDNFTVAYASKAFSCKEIYRIVHREGLGVDVVSGGELYTALSAGFPADKIYFHGNNKTAAELQYALDADVRRIVVDNETELELLSALTDKPLDISVRLCPRIEAHTHEFVQTGQLDSKFGVDIQNSDAFLERVLALPNINLVGIHCHIGSQIFDAEPFAEIIKKFVAHCAHWRNKYGVIITEMNLGGGFGISYTNSDTPRPIADIVRETCEHMKSACAAHNYPLPHIVVEPGRAIVGNAGLTLYTVGNVKNVPGVRTYIALDGGLTDNPRYALYQAEHFPLTVSSENGDRKPVTLAGRNCETGDLLAENVPLAPVKPGERIALLSTGAYTYSMASHYNRIPKPPVIMITNGKTRVIINRETYQDITRQDI